MQFGRRIAWMSTLLAMAAAQAPALAESCYPLALGYQWKYQSAHGEHDTETIVDTTTMWGHEVYVKEWSESTWNNGFVWWTSTDSTGAGLLWGIYQSGASEYGWLYYPPVKLVPGTQAVGDQWSDTTLVRFLPDTTQTMTLMYTRRIYSNEVLALPFGEIQAYGIGYESLSANAAMCGLRDDREAGEWFAPGIGIVRYTSSDRYELTEYNFLVIPAEDATWGRLKFRWLPSAKGRGTEDRVAPMGTDTEPLRLR
jgi:hypothetical protein